MIIKESNAYAVQTVSKVKRWVKGKKRIDVKQPAVTGHENTKINGVDLIERTLSNYRLSIYGTKWYWLLLVNVLNIGFVYYLKFSRILTGEHIEQKFVYCHTASILLRCLV